MGDWKSSEVGRRHSLEQVGGHLQDRSYLKEGMVKLGQDYRGLEWPGSQMLMIGHWVAIGMR